MENATKALIIAAAILIAIVVIALGVRIMSSSSDTTDRVDTTATTTSIQSFNAQFNPYIGKKLNQTELQNLKILVNTSNKHNAQQVSLVDATHSEVVTSKYEIKAKYDDDGYIEKLTYYTPGYEPSEDEG